MKWNVFISLELTKHPGPLWLFLFIYLFVCFLPFFLPFFFFTPSPPPPPPLLPPFVIFFRFCFRYSKSVDWKFYAQQISTSLSPANDQRVETMDNAEAYIHICVRVCVFGRNFIIVGTSVHLSTEMFFRANSSVRGEEGRAWSMQRTMIRQNHHRIYVSNIKTHHRQSTRNKIERCGDWIDGDGDG